MLLAAPRGHDEAAMAGTWRKVAIAHHALHRTINAARRHPAWTCSTMAKHSLEQAILEGL